MITREMGNVLEIISETDEISVISVQINGRKEKAVNYNKLTGGIEVGDSVLLNTTAVKLGLGTGGYHFVMANISSCQLFPKTGPGHIMKLKYTPFQLKTLDVGEKDSPYHEKIKNFKDMKNMPVVIGSLHSQLPAAIAGILYVNNTRPVYIMTDGGALPLAFSKTVSYLKEKGFIKATITAGHAFGGDLEAINIYTALIAAREVLKAKIAVVLMGPGLAGTATPFGFTGIEQGEIINAVEVLGGKAIAIPRISFADPRPRHRGISHHTITSLSKVALVRALLPIPHLEDDKAEIIQKQLEKTGLIKKHDVIKKDARKAVEFARRLKLPLSSMGREVDENKEFFLAAAAAGMTAAELVYF